MSTQYMDVLPKSQGTLKEYHEYQKRYATEPRASDVKLIELLKSQFSDERSRRVLDVGCSTGNFLLLLKRQLPGFELSGIDLCADAVTECKTNEALVDCDISARDATSIESFADFEVVTTNAATFCWDEATLETFTRALGRSLPDGAVYAGFELLHGFNQHLEVIERSKKFPDGISLFLRPIRQFRDLALDSGFSTIEFHPFFIPLDLPLDLDKVEHLGSYSVRSDSGRMSFRGALCQPWCHFVAVK